MGGLLDLRRGIGQERDAQLAAGIDAQAVALGVSHLAPARTWVVAALLRHRVGRDALRRAGLPHAQRCTVQSIRVHLNGAEAVEAQVVN